MAVMIKCKMCGGDLNVTEGVSVVECEYCGSRQTIPNQDSEKKLTLFARADRLRRACEFDKAAGVYESIVAEFPEEAEAYWGLVLCRYGIEYVDDPATGKKVPTCHRSSFDSILEDADFDQACENADPIARRQYREEAKAIEGIRKGILEVSSKEEPYDIFICYKETDENGGRTIDSVIAQDVYDALTEKGYRVFFSRISLEDKLGTEYEPYIFAALNSAKVMLAFGTDFEYFNAVWVKNEWSRFLALMAAGQKKTLIPCYKNLDAYDMPKEFQRLQAQDMGKVGAIQDLLRGIGKIIPRETEVVEKTVVVQQSAAPAAPGVESLLKRGWMFLTDQDWAKADEYFDKVLDIDPEKGEAYAGKLCASQKCSERAELAAASPFGQDRNYQKAVSFGSGSLKAELEGYLAQAEEDKRRQEEEERQRAISVLVEKRKKLAPAAGLIGGGTFHTVGLKVDGAVVATKYTGDSSLYHGQCDVSGWTDIVAVAAGSDHTVGLKADGTVVATEYTSDSKCYFGQCNVSGWTDVVAVAAGKWHTVGLKADGTVVAAGGGDVSGWTDIVAIAAGVWHTVGLKSDGTVVAVGDNDKGQCGVSDWTDIVAVAAGEDHTVGLKADGTVVVTKYTGDSRLYHDQYDVSGWTDIVAVAAGGSHTVGLKADGTVVAVGKNFGGQCNVSGWRDVVAVAAWDYHTVGLKADGTVVAAGSSSHGQCDVSGWKLFNGLDTLEQEREKRQEKVYVQACLALDNIKREPEEEAEVCGQKFLEVAALFAGIRGYRDADEKRAECLRLDEEKRKKVQPFLEKRRKELAPAAGLIGSGNSHVGLKADGTVVAAGDNRFGECEVSGWRDIVAVAAGECHTVGLKADGTVVATEYTGDYYHGQCEVSGWRDIVAVSAGYSHTVGLKSDGTVVATEYTGDSKYYFGQCEVSGWTNIVAVAAEECHTVGLKADGTVIAAGDNDSGEYDVSGWRDIVAVAEGECHTVGLKADGTVVTTDSSDKKEISGWRDVVAVAAGECHTVGLKADGTVVAAGDNDSGECDVSGWRLFNSFENLKQERIEAKAERQRQGAERQRQEAERQARITALNAEKQYLQAELPTLKGLFSGGKRRQIEARLAQIETELNSL